MPKLLFLSGSTRKGSVNTTLATLACTIAESQGADASLIDLKDYSMPIYNGDEESENGLPESAIRLKKLFRQCDGFFIASPEYNSSISPLLKNTLDWISRPHEDNEPVLSAYSGKVAAISAASPGGFGGLRGLVPLRMMLSNIGVILVPGQVAISNASAAFDADGNLNNEMYKNILTQTITQLIQFAGK